jgi:hypothetical protein
MELGMTEASGADFSTQRAEVTFFMEKAFEISLFYFAGLGAFVALSKSDVMTAAAKFSGIPLVGLLSLGVLLLNLVYLILAIACLFAVLKRGLFILEHTVDRRSQDSSSQSMPSMERAWEGFVRESLITTGSPGRLRALAWNIDNYYMVPLFVIILGASTVSAIVAFALDSWLVRAMAAVLIILYVVPGFMAMQLEALNHECRVRLGHGQQNQSSSGE